MTVGLAVSVVIGPDEHGVVRQALAAAGAAGIAVVRRSDALDRTPVPSPVTAPVAHLHYTDRLFGAHASEGPARLAALIEELDRPTIVSLHDVPDQDGTVRGGMRAAAYRSVGERADVVVVASEHERVRLRRCGVDGDVRVIPLAIETGGRVARAPARRGRAVIGVLGFVYPGKGHDEAIDVAATLPHSPEVWALGRASDGHDDLVAALRARAHTRRCGFLVAGFLPDDDLAVAMARVDVPLAAAHDVSASASVGTWISAGRRPLVRSGPYADELDERASGLITRFDTSVPGALRAGVERALAEPASTWCGVVPEALRPTAIAGQHLELYRSLGSPS